ncbi:hypothetical protein KPH14_004596 [Odynerus spinipes]|uniref:Uncharacterized protein n=1 Tax=Odynerus spinipes TaxID=1348599 RepID=A0AAD9RMJ3_9HYME|nr:hypothetical protein KPH14_004596 [Odynerus spinipes]
MIPRISFASLLLVLTTASAVTLPEITSYAKVSRNGQETKSTGSGPFSWITRAFTGTNVSSSVENEGRSVKDIVITVSPIYIPPRTPKLKNGEAIDYPSTKRYSTIDKELLAKLDSTKSKAQIQERFHPPASFEHSAKQVASNPPMPSASDSGSDGPPSSAISGYSRPIYSGTYDFKPSGYDKPKDYLSDKPISKPIGFDSYPSIMVNDKPSDAYKTQLDSYPSHQDDDTDFPSFSSGPSYDEHAAPKPIEFDGPSFSDDAYPHDHDHYHHEVIYDHLPEYHHHPTTPQPEMNDQRLDKRPYSYYFIGKKLWYIPLYFSIYFIIYIAALVLKSIARHKIAFPAHLADAVGHGRKDSSDVGWWDLTNRVLGGIERFAERFGKGS